jgi:hypothetical protein
MAETSALAAQADGPSIPTMPGLEPSLLAAWRSADLELVRQVVARPSAAATIYVARGPRRLEGGVYEMILGIAQAEGVLGLDLKLGADPSVTIESLTPAGVAELFALDSHADSSGTRRISIYSAVPMQGTGDFLVVRMRIDGPLMGLPFELDGEANEGMIRLIWAPGAPVRRPGPTPVSPVQGGAVSIQTSSE